MAGRKTLQGQFKCLGALSKKRMKIQDSSKSYLKAN